MDWAALRDHWPGAQYTQFVHARPHRWHVQCQGPADAPVVLLLHGTGAATHSWRDLAPVLARNLRVVGLDLPGHGFTKLGALQRSAPTMMAQDVAQVMAKLDLRPKAIVGHSAGFALALMLVDTLPQRPRALIGLNAALDNFKGAAGWLFPMMAKALALNPFVAPTVARLSTPEGTRRLIQATGSRIDAAGLACYGACLADAAHVDGALTMMAQWRLDPVQAVIARLDIPTLLITGAGDKAVAPSTSTKAARRMAQAQLLNLPGLGHLAHEEAPDLVAQKIEEMLARHLPQDA